MGPPQATEYPRAVDLWPYLGHEGDLERAGHLLLEGSHLLQESSLPEPGLGQPGVPRGVVVEGEGQDQGLCL